MATCPNCGFRKLALRRSRCEACGKSGCRQCLRPVALVDSRDLGDEGPEWWLVCSGDCAGELATRIGRHVGPPTLWKQNPHRSVRPEDRQYTFARPFRYRPRTGAAAGRSITIGWLGVTQEFHDAIRSKVRALVQAGALPEYAEDMKAAAYLGTVGLLEEAARLFEKWQLREEAIAARIGSAFGAVRNVSVDLAPLIKFVRDEGLSIPFRCKGCGSTVRTDASGRGRGNHACAHCGSTYDKLEVLQLVASAVR